MHIARQLAAALALLLAAAVPCPSNAADVRRDLAEAGPSFWREHPWVSAEGEIADGAAAGAETPVAFRARFDGQGFKQWGADLPGNPVPGTCDVVRVAGTITGEGVHWSLLFNDADGNAKVGDQKLELPLRFAADRIDETTLTVPPEWKRPLTLVGVRVHNWSSKTTEQVSVLQLTALEVQTDTTSVADHGSLLSVSLTTGRPRNVFTGDEEIRARLVVDSWLGEAGDPVPVTYQWRAHDGRTLKTGDTTVSLGGHATVPIGFAPPEFGVYGLRAALAPEGASIRTLDLQAALVPPPRELSDSRRHQSPYGLNIHGGLPGVAYNAIATLGVTWVRDYAYSLEWMRRARGDDGRYAGWPWYPRMDAALRESGLMLLPCLAGGLENEIHDKGHLVPTKQWRSDLLHLMMAFPHYPAWETDNEYDYHCLKEERAREWRTYDHYHKTFADLVHILDPDVLAVEQGTAGVHPDWVRRSVGRGAFDGIDVVNGHFYCGTSPPEISRRNANVGGDRYPPIYIGDTLREFAEAADSDGRDRQAWITEFGWDTLAVHVVTELQQAAYLQRGYLLGLDAGIDRMFWYWNRDTKETPDNFFDGCGIFGPEDEPKPAAAALAALAWMLPLPDPIGRFELGDNGMGYRFRDRLTGDDLACVFRVDPQRPAEHVILPDSDIRDMFGNPLPAGTHQLTVAPVWVRGLPEGHRWHQAADHRLLSRRLVRVPAGERVVLRLESHNRGTAAAGLSIDVSTPWGWACETARVTGMLAPGGTRVSEFTVRIPVDTDEGIYNLAFQIDDRDDHAMAKRIRVEVIPAATVTTRRLSDRPGREDLQVTVANHAATAREFLVRTRVPDSWSRGTTVPAMVTVPGNGTKEVALPITWTDHWEDEETAGVDVTTPGGQPVATTGITPGAWGLARADSALDGRLGDWPAASRLPRWALVKPPAGRVRDLRLGYCSDGLLVGVWVEKTRAEIPNPKSFWACDSVELFLRTSADRTTTEYGPGDHQFWLCPLVTEGRVYAGRWKRGSETAATQYDLAAVKGVSRVEGDGYVLEALIPAEVIDGWTGDAGETIRLGICVNTPGSDGIGTTAWPRRKSEGLTDDPSTWGRVRLR